MTTTTALLVGLVLLVANAFFVASEFAILAARRSKVEALAAQGSRAARSALAGMRELSLMLAGAQLGITMASLGLGAVAEPAIHRGLDVFLAATPIPRPVSLVLSLALALGVTVFLHMVFGEMAPKSWAISRPQSAVLLLAPPFRLFVTVLRPFIGALNGLSNLVVRACGVEPQRELAQAHSPSDLVLLLRESAKEGTLGAEEQTLLTRAIDLSGLDAESAMTPRRDIVSVPADAGIDEIERVTSSSGRSRLPVHTGDLDRYIGVLHVKDLLEIEPEDRAGVTAGALARRAMATPESRPAEELMLEMRSQRQHVALVVDEFGSVVGLVALEDLLEELIGDFEDETDHRRPVTRRADGAVLVPGTLRPHEVANLLDVALPPGDWETLGGYVMAKLERFPAVGDRVETDDVLFEVTRMEGYRVEEIAVTPRV
jgi:CBS domain containing-hemolysin-like protein